MKALLCWLALGLAGAAQAAPRPKTVQDPAEYQAYMAALGQKEPGRQAAAMEAFAARYPASVMKLDALESALSGYQRTQDLAKAELAAGAVLKLEADNVRALAFLAYLDRSRGDAKLAGRLRDRALRGLKALKAWPKPEDMSEAAFARQRGELAKVFNGAAGYCALQAKDHAAARAYYLKAVESDWSDAKDLYELSVADLELKPLDPDGFWSLGRAMHLSQGNPRALKLMSDYGRAKYRRYHGGEDGFEDFVARPGVLTAPPAGFAKTIKPAPSDAELAVRAAAENDPAELSFDDWEFILSQRDASPANRQAAAKVWDAILARQQGGAAKLRLPVKVVSAGKQKLKAAIVEENQRADRADLTVTLAKPLDEAPAKGEQVQVLGLLKSYETKPFMFIMKEGELAK